MAYSIRVKVIPIYQLLPTTLLVQAEQSVRSRVRTELNDRWYRYLARWSSESRLQVKFQGQCHAKVHGYGTKSVFRLKMLTWHHFDCTSSTLQAPRRNAPLIRFLISALSLYCLLLYIVCSFPIYPFSSFFPYSSFPLRIYPLRFQAGCRKRRRKPGFSFSCLFCVAEHFFWLANACFCFVGFSFFHAKPRDWLGEMSPKWPVFVSSGTKNRNSINETIEAGVRAFQLL